MATVAVHGNHESLNLITKVDLEADLRQQARDFHIPDYSPPWAHHIHSAVEEANKAAEEWALYHFHTLVGSKRFSKVMKSNITDVLAAGVYCTGPTWGVEFAMEYFVFLFVMDDEVLQRTTNESVLLASSSKPSPYEGGTAQIFVELFLVMMSTFPREKSLVQALEKILSFGEKWDFTKVRARIEKFLAQAERHPGTVDFSDEVGSSPVTAAFRNLWKRATAVMPEDWSLRFAYMSQRDMFAMFKESHEGNPGLTANSVSEYTQARRDYGFPESSLVVGELAEGIQVSSAIYYSPPMQSLVQAMNDIVNWHNDIYSFQKELLAGEVNLLHLISKKEGCSYSRAAEIVNDMVVERCKDLSLAAAELMQHAESEEKSPFPDRENAAKYIRLCTNFVSATHDFHTRSSRFHF